MGGSPISTGSAYRNHQILNMPPCGLLNENCFFLNKRLTEDGGFTYFDRLSTSQSPNTYYPAMRLIKWKLYFSQ